MKMPDQFECRTCGKSFTSKTNWRRHEKQMHQELDEGDKFSCPECSKSFIRKHDLCRHIVARHTDLSKEQHLCEVCNQTFARESLLKKHMEVHEDGSQKLICHLCCVPFKSKKFLERHLSVHARKENTGQFRKRIGDPSMNLYNTMQLLEPFVAIGKSSKKSSKKADTLVAYEEVSAMDEGQQPMDEESDTDGDNVVENQNRLNSISGLETKSQSSRKCAKQTENSVNIEELSPDQYVIDYVKNKMKETEQESYRQQFLLSLLPDVREMSSSQFRSFRQNVCNLIDSILQPDILQQSNPPNTEESSSLEC